MSERTGGGAAPKAMIGCGGLLLVLSLAVTLFSAFHVLIDPRGNISDEEAMPSMLGGILCLLVSVTLAGVGAVLAVRKKDGGASAGGAGSAPGAPGGGAKPKKEPFPTHLLAGCLSLFALASMCLTFGSALYFYGEADSYESRARSARSRRSYGGYGGYYGLSPYYYEDKADEMEQMGMGSACCGAFMFLLFLGGAVGGVVLMRRNRAEATEGEGGGPGSAPGSGPGSAPGGGPQGFGSPPQGPGPPPS
ncbi:MAG TPA: hypothetical protein RMH99_24095 [Sandaracinaceae bacterium LLY-WYZ-13_1]|nr:hypothetical protein [Sandaracinaceae bacterium LLY-WYZ-13_1]